MLHYRDDDTPVDSIPFESFSESPSTNSIWDLFDEHPKKVKNTNNTRKCMSVDVNNDNYRLNLRHCNGLDTASFVCQIPGNNISICFFVAINVKINFNDNTTNILTK